MESREAALYLTELIRGDLDDSRRAAVMATVAADPDLRALEAWLRQLLRLESLAGGSVFAHPAGDHLVAFALDPDHADAETAAHAVSCPACREQVAVTRQLAGELGTARRSLWQKAARAMRQNGPPLLLGVAATLLVVLLSRGPTEAPAPMAPEGMVRTVLVDGSVRGDQLAVPTIPLSGTASVVLLLGVDAFDAETVDVVLSRDGAVVWTWQGEAADVFNPDLALISLWVPATVLSSGAHDLRVDVDGTTALQRTIVVEP